MKYICLGHLEPGTFVGMTEDERHAVLDEFRETDGCQRRIEVFQPSAERWLFGQGSSIFTKPSSNTTR